MINSKHCEICNLYTITSINFCDTFHLLYIFITQESIKNQGMGKVMLHRLVRLEIELLYLLKVSVIINNNDNNNYHNNNSNYLIHSLQERKILWRL